MHYEQIPSILDFRKLKIQVMDYDSRPCFPPPFTIIYHAYLILKYYTTATKKDMKAFRDHSLS